MTSSELQNLINSSAQREIKLSGKIQLNFVESKTLMIGRHSVKSSVRIDRPNIIVDGTDADIEIELLYPEENNLSVFFLSPTAKNVEFRNMHITLKVSASVLYRRRVSLIYNTGLGFKIKNCRLEMSSSRQVEMMGIYNNGNLDTHLQTRADCLVVENSDIHIECIADECEKECRVYGIYNSLANSISVQNNFINVINKGIGRNQEAVGVYTDGRFGRFVSNNIKANAAHNLGKSKEQGSAISFINKGLHTIISANNLVGEWGGFCVGLENLGDFAIITSNKILSTHTICGRTIRNYGSRSNIQGNVLVSTSRNGRLVENDARNCIITHNLMEITMDKDECISGCGIYALSSNNGGNIIAENIIRNVLNCGIFVGDSVGHIKDNRVESYESTVAFSDMQNMRLLKLLDEKNIKTISN